jgi:hypothetical protein
MSTIRCALPPEDETTRRISPSAAIDAEAPVSIAKKIQRSSPDQPSNSIGPGDSSPDVLPHTLAE